MRDFSSKIKKKSVRNRFILGLLLVLMIGAIIVFCSLKIKTTQFVQSEDAKADIAVLATASSDYTSDWEKVAGINNGDFEPGNSSCGAGQGWGNWPQSEGSKHFVQYNWNEKITADAFDIYWYDDGGETRIPSEVTFQYQDLNGQWLDVKLKEQDQAFFEINQYNSISIEPITAKALRMTMTIRPGSKASGVYRWKVYGTINDQYITDLDAKMLTIHSQVYSDFYLKSKGTYGSKITWISNNPAITIDKNNAIVTKGETDVTGTIVATVTKGKSSVNKEFDVTVTKSLGTSFATPVDFTNVHINDAFWSPKQKLITCETIQAGIKKVEEPSAGMENFKSAALKNAGQPNQYYHGTVFFLDSDCYKLIEAMGYALQLEDNGDQQIIEAKEKIKDKLEEWIPYIQGAQEADGYLGTYFTLENSPETEIAIESQENKPEKFTDFSHHELYMAGHFYEAAIAYTRTMKYEDTRLFDVAIKNADLIVKTFGDAPGQRKNCPGHEEIELALFKLAAACEESGKPEYIEKAESYRKLAYYFIEVRGDLTGRYGYYSYGGFGTIYNQDHLPATEQMVAVGHSVRAMYLYIAMADAAMLANTDIYDEALLSLWDDVANKKTYVTGGIGSAASYEGFGDAYDLPNDTAYAETCANIGSFLWNQRLNMLYGDSQYADVMESTLYNSIISCVNFEGDKFFYSNPMSSTGDIQRSSWFGCACCPPNLMRIVESLGSYIYTQNMNVITQNLYIGNDASLNIGDEEVNLNTTTDMPWYGTSTITVSQANNVTFTLRLRVSQWATGENKVKVNGTEVDFSKNLDEDGYLLINRKWVSGDVITIDFPMETIRYYSDKNIKTNNDYVAIMRGPIVFAAEGIDNNFDISSAVIPKASELKAEYTDNLMADGEDPYGVKCGIVITCDGKTVEGENDLQWRLIPYYAWNNRSVGTMTVYIHDGK